MSDQIVYLNGEFSPLSEAKISVLDRGFLFGDGVYEVIPVYERHSFRQAQHLARMQRSLEKIQIANPYTMDEWKQKITQLCQLQDSNDQLVYIQVTRGVAKRMHAFPANITPTVFMMSNPFPHIAQAEREKGVRCVSLMDQRWHHCDIKSTSLLGNVMAAQFAVEHDGVESLQFRDEYLTEGSASNVWIVKDGAMFGPPLNNLILEGIRVEFFHELCASMNISLQHRPISHAEVVSADEVLISSASKEVLAVVQLDEHTIGNGQIGPMYKALYAAYQNAKKVSQVENNSAQLIF
jgi:D-alanine transaminase